MAESRTLFLLTRQTRQRRDGLEFTFFCHSADGPVRLRFTGREAGFFIGRDVQHEAGIRTETQLRTLSGEPVDVLRFAQRRALNAEADRLLVAGTPGLETDVKPVDRFLMERMITAGCVATGPIRQEAGFVELLNPAIEPADMSPNLRVASFDVESEGMAGPILSVAITSSEERVFVRGTGPELRGVSYHPDEPSVLRGFLGYVRDLDPDVLIGWNVVEFDVRYLEQRCRQHRVPFLLGRGSDTARVLTGGRPGAPAVAIVPGRVVLDGIATMRAATWSFERWGLDDVAQTLLGRRKAIQKTGDKLQEILRMYREELPKFVEYNLEDCRLVQEIFRVARVLEFAIERQRLTGLTMDRRAGAVASFDYLYLPRLHKRGRVAPTTGHRTDAPSSPGGVVMSSRPGLFRNVLVLDFKSLYPSLIRTFLVDPLGLAVASTTQDQEASVAGFDGARFSRTEHILPGLIATLWEARTEAKRIGDAALSQAVKIQMNSFYGVLGSPSCRFFDPRLASSITRRGHEVLRTTRAWIEEHGYAVIYGDTDSLFVLLGEEGGDERACLATGETLAAELNSRWREVIRQRDGVESALELELERCFVRFLMPTMRGSEVGSKKRYAGVADGKLIIKGLEAIRSDWTPLARSFQTELLRRVFADEPYEAWLRQISVQLFAGELDSELIYRKRIRRDLDSYVRNVPPHITAARQLDRPVRVVEYVITTRGAQPVERVTAAIDYTHYLERQLAPAADVILPLLGDRFMRHGSRQLSLF
ncbi:MAG TPA: DNA polymerase II [Polyangiaceae bacterium]|nr:DNA polymerase II [Polyangiaceae bacterium]